MRPYRLPTAASGFKGVYTPNAALAFVRPRGSVGAIRIPDGSTRMQLHKYLNAYRYFDARGRYIARVTKPMRDFANHVPDATVVEVYVNETSVVVSDVLQYRDFDVRNDSFSTRMGHWWYLPQEFSTLVFISELNFSNLSRELFFNDTSKILFKADFAVYPRKTGARVFNWLIMGKPLNVDESKTDVDRVSVRHIGANYRPRNSGGPSSYASQSP